MKEFKEFEKKFGFECYDEIKKIFASMYQKIEELKESRDKWRDRYFELKKK